MKKAAIIALACMNAVLLLALVFSSGTPQARAQGYVPWDYLMVTAQQPGSNTETVYVIDLAKGGLVGLGFDQGKKVLVQLGEPRNLRNDFKTQGGAP